MTSLLPYLFLQADGMHNRMKLMRPKGKAENSVIVFSLKAEVCNLP